MNATLPAEPLRTSASTTNTPGAPAATNQLLARTSVRVAILSVLVVTPCFWQLRIQAGDLSSHLYNAWLSILIGEGKAPGLWIAPQWTNVLFDLILSGLMRVMGPWGAEHVAVPLAVLVFFWGAFAAVCKVSGSRPWFMLIFLALLAYGWVFHMGFMNFYLAAGLCFWAFALLWRPKLRSTILAIPLITLACAAHMVPVAWLAGSIAYTWIARRIRPRARPILMISALALLVIVRTFLMAHFPTRWSAEQMISMTGADQISVFSGKYDPLEFILLAIWLSLFARSVKHRRGGRLMLGIPFQLCAIASAAVLLLPGALLLPMYAHPLRYIAERMSLLVGVSGCALLGGVVPGRWEKLAATMLLGVFFSFLYADTRALNRVEDLLERSVTAVPAGARVISALCDQRGDVNLLAHMLDRVCIRRCFSYANYEPAANQFRVRTSGVNPIVVANDADSGALQLGAYTVRSYDAPLYQIYLRGRYLDLRLLQASEVTGATCFEAIPGFNDVLHARNHDSN